MDNTRYFRPRELGPQPEFCWLLEEPDKVQQFLIGCEFWANRALKWFGEDYEVELITLEELEEAWHDTNRQVN